MISWFMVTLVGKDQKGIVARITTTLYENGYNLGESSMLRLGGNFTIMMMVSCEGTTQELNTILHPLAEDLQLHLHVDTIEGHLHQHKIPDVRICVYGADRAGIVAQVTQALAHAGLNILDLESDVGGNIHEPFYIMQIEGVASEGIDTLEQALHHLLTDQPDLQVTLEPIETVTM